ncbi:MAG TPA: GDSL-type esterase/lipase family protein [Acidimicrobiales bacterium]|nr:GDSL-type esterase/lipase family protein [Acidimicrobiales bacterium]
MRRGRWLVALAAMIVGTASLVAVSPWAGGATSVPFPNSMAAAGDSITRAFGATWSRFLSDSPQYSWSTGNDTAVDSQYRRILAANPAINGHVYNHAMTGAKMVDLDGQVKAAAREQVQYLTVLMGANDVCAPSAATMTATTTFRAEFSQALSDFFAADPGAHVFVSSIPNLSQLWNTLHGSWTAEVTWRVAHICSSLLSRSNTAAARQAVATREQADNAALASVCSEHPRCRWDGYAVYHLSFTASDISRVDHLHPNAAGEHALAATTWAAGFWPTTR